MVLVVRCVCAQDNCFFEFQYASQVRPNNMIAVVLEPEVRNTANWKGLLRSMLGGSLYIDMTDESQWRAKARELAARVLPEPGKRPNLLTPQCLHVLPASQPEFT